MYSYSPVKTNWSHRKKLVLLLGHLPITVVSFFYCYFSVVTFEILSDDYSKVFTFYFYLYVYVCLCGCPPHVCNCPWIPEEGIRSSGGYELLCGCWVLCKSSKCPSLLSCLSSPETHFSNKYFFYLPSIKLKISV